VANLPGDVVELFLLAVAALDTDESGVEATATTACTCRWRRAGRSWSGAGLRPE
jgi:hypothetical protein